MLQPVVSNPYAQVEDLLRTKDARTVFGLSGDQNLSAGQRANIQFALDCAAGELESIIYGYVPLPLPVARVPASGQITVTGVPADNSTLILSDGLISPTLTFLSGGTAINQIDTASGSPATIAGLIGVAIPLNNLGIVWENTGIVLSLQNAGSGTQGNVAIVTTSPLVSAVGMSGGGLQIPFILKKWVCAKAAESMFARRSDMPEQIRQQVAWADKWATDFIGRRVSIPGITRSGIGLFNGPPVALVVACTQWNVDWCTGLPLTDGIWVA